MDSGRRRTFSSGGPARQDRRFFRLSLEIAVDAETRGPDQLSSAVQQRQPLAQPRRYFRFLQQVLEAAPGTAAVRAQALAAAAQPDLHRARAQPGEADPGA